jgi:UDP-N-acetylmuramoyl-tripeptide--D-alanyl-D-alanine ligase
MAELGAQTDGEHRRMQLLAEELGIEVVGYQTGLYGDARVDDVDTAVALLRGLGTGDAALVKGSRVAQLEDVARAYGAAAGVQSLVTAAAPQA